MKKSNQEKVVSETNNPVLTDGLSYDNYAKERNKATEKDVKEK